MIFRARHTTVQVSYDGFVESDVAECKTRDQAKMIADALNAIQVLTLTPHVRKYLEEHDPKALAQAVNALRGVWKPTDVGECTCCGVGGGDAMPVSIDDEGLCQECFEEGRQAITNCGGG